MIYAWRWNPLLCILYLLELLRSSPSCCSLRKLGRCKRGPKSVICPYALRIWRKRDVESGSVLFAGLWIIGQDFKVIGSQLAELFAFSVLTVVVYITYIGSSVETVGEDVTRLNMNTWEHDAQPSVVFPWSLEHYWLRWSAINAALVYLWIVRGVYPVVFDALTAWEKVQKISRLVERLEASVVRIWPLVVSILLVWFERYGRLKMCVLTLWGDLKSALMRGSRIEYLVWGSECWIMFQARKYERIGLLAAFVAGSVFEKWAHKTNAPVTEVTLECTFSDRRCVASNFNRFQR